MEKVEISLTEEVTPKIECYTVYVQKEGDPESRSVRVSSSRGKKKTRWFCKLGNGVVPSGAAVLQHTCRILPSYVVMG